MKRRIVFFAALILWIVYAKDQLLPIVTAALWGEPTVGYIATGLITFAGSWILWRLVKG